jgi:hypothetical protein
VRETDWGVRVSTGSGFALVCDAIVTEGIMGYHGGDTEAG